MVCLYSWQVGGRGGWAALGRPSEAITLEDKASLGGSHDYGGTVFNLKRNNINRCCFGAGAVSSAQSYTWLFTESIVRYLMLWQMLLLLFTLLVNVSENYF